MNNIILHSDRLIHAIVCNTTDLRLSERMILAHLASYASGKNGACWPSEKELSRKANCTAKTVRQHTKTLEDKGYLVVSTRPTARGWAKHYVIVAKKVVPDAPAEYIAANEAAISQINVYTTVNSDSSAVNTTAVTSVTTVNPSQNGGKSFLPSAVNSTAKHAFNYQTRLNNKGNANAPAHVGGSVATLDLTSYETFKAWLGQECVSKRIDPLINQLLSVTSSPANEYVVRNVLHALYTKLHRIGTITNPTALLTKIIREDGPQLLEMPPVTPQKVNLATTNEETTQSECRRRLVAAGCKESLLKSATQYLINELQYIKNNHLTPEGWRDDNGNEVRSPEKFIDTKLFHRKSIQYAIRKAGEDDWNSRMLRWDGDDDDL